MKEFFLALLAFFTSMCAFAQSESVPQRLSDILKVLDTSIWDIRDSKREGERPYKIIHIELQEKQPDYAAARTKGEAFAAVVADYAIYDSGYFYPVIEVGVPCYNIDTARYGYYQGRSVLTNNSLNLYKRGKEYYSIEEKMNFLCIAMQRFDFLVMDNTLRVMTFVPDPHGFTKTYPKLMKQMSTMFLRYVLRKSTLKHVMVKLYDENDAVYDDGYK